MTRGDQRDRDRAKKQSKLAEGEKGKRKDGKSVGQARENDADIMRKKQEAAAAKKAAASS